MHSTLLSCEERHKLLLELFTREKSGVLKEIDLNYDGPVQDVLSSPAGCTSHVADTFLYVWIFTYLHVWIFTYFYTFLVE